MRIMRRAVPSIPFNSEMVLKKVSQPAPPANQRSEMSAEKWFIGIDPGAKGAIAVVNDDYQLVDVTDIPAVKNGAGRTVVVAELVAQHFRGLAPVVPTVVALEQVWTRPGEGAVGACAFCRTAGVLEGVVAGIGWPIVIVSPQRWKSGYQVAGDKDLARLLACRTWPQQAGLFARKKDVDRADAALIALWAAQTHLKGSL